jgi:iron complex transport system permease protein
LFWLPVAAGMTILLAFLHLGIGARPVSPHLFVEVIAAYDPASFDQQVLIKLRLPRLLAGMLCGACLGVAGLLLQSLLRNPLGEPHILGLNAGASLSVVLCAALPAGLVPIALARPLIAALGGGMLFALVLALASAGRTGLTMTKMTFCGIALSALASACVSAILILDQDTLEQMRFWLAGDLAGVSMVEIRASLPIVIAALLATAFVSLRLDIMALGDAAATGLGVPVWQTRLIGLTATALFCGAAVSIAGPIGFVGLIVPGLAHRLAKRNHVLSLPLAALFGASLVIAADIGARTIAMPREFATGIMTAFIGAPVFLVIVARVVR